MSDGLEGVVVAETRISAVDGERGQLLIRGWPISELAGIKRFENVVSLMLGGSADEPRPLGEARVRAFERVGGLGGALQLSNGMDALRAAVAQTESDAPADLIGAMAVFAAAWSRRRRDLSPVPPDPQADHGRDYLRMLRDAPPTDAEALAMDAYFSTVVDHGMNASTFTARVITSTESDLVSAAVGAIGALKGRLHGGAPGPVLDMLDAVGSPDGADAWIAEQLRAGARIMGMGHRVYRVRDPRAAVLERVVQELLGATDSERLRLARAVEQSAERQLAVQKPGRSIRANVEFYTALLLEALHIDRALFTPTFACARVVGWCAHAAEQRRTGRLIRPRARYVGPIRGTPAPAAAAR